MMVIRVELWSANTGQKTEIARMHIANTGEGTRTRGDYTGASFIGRSAADLDRRRVSKSGLVERWPRNELHVWNLVARMLAVMGYDQGPRP